MVVGGGRRGCAAMSPDLPVSYRLRGSIIPACRDPSSSFSFYSSFFLSSPPVSSSASSSVHRPAVGLFDPRYTCVAVIVLSVVLLTQFMIICWL